MYLIPVLEIGVRSRIKPKILNAEFQGKQASLFRRLEQRNLASPMTACHLTEKVMHLLPGAKSQCSKL